MPPRDLFKHLRRRQIARRIFDAFYAIEDESTVPRATTGADPIARDLVQRALRHLHSMNPHRAAAFVLHDALGYELKELAQMMGIGVSAAQSRVVRGRRELRGRLVEDAELADFVEARPS